MAIMLMTAVVGAVAALLGLDASGSSLVLSSARVRPAATAFALGVRMLAIDEPSRPGIATNRLDGRPVRRLPTLLLYPTAGTPGQPDRPDAPADVDRGPFPLIVFSEGFDSSVAPYRWLLDAWARAGYVVAAPAYPRNQPGTPGGVDESDIVHHPADLVFVISTLTSAAMAASGSLAGLVNPAEVAIAGHSDGAAVTLAAAANRCCRIAAVKAAVILSGAELSVFHGGYYASGSVPLLVTQGNRDTVNTPGCSVALYDQAPAPKYYVDLLGAEHLTPYVQPGPARRFVASTVVAFLDDYLKQDASPLAALLSQGGVPQHATLSDVSHLRGLSTDCP